MYIMYTTNRSGAMDIDLKWQLPDPDFDTIKRQALRMLKYRHSAPGCIKHLEETPYSLCIAHNDFGDEFAVLRWIASPKEYTEMERFVDEGNYLEQDCFLDICEAFSTVGHPLRFIVMDLDLTADDDAVSTVAPPVLRTTSETVEAALKDAETLINTSGAPNAFDRVHTAFHAYLREICEDDPLTYDVPDDADITKLTKNPPRCRRVSRDQFVEGTRLRLGPACQIKMPDFRLPAAPWDSQPFPRHLFKYPHDH